MDSSWDVPHFTLHVSVCPSALFMTWLGGQVLPVAVGYRFGFEEAIGARFGQLGLFQAQVCGRLINLIDFTRITRVRFSQEMGWNE